MHKPAPRWAKIVGYRSVRPNGHCLTCAVPPPEVKFTSAAKDRVCTGENRAQQGPARQSCEASQSLSSGNTVLETSNSHIHSVALLIPVRPSDRHRRCVLPAFRPSERRSRSAAAREHPQSWARWRRPTALPYGQSLPFPQILNLRFLAHLPSMGPQRCAALMLLVALLACGAGAPRCAATLPRLACRNGGHGVLS